MIKKYFVATKKIRNDIENKIADFLNLFQNEFSDNAEISLFKIAIKQGLSTATSGSVTLTEEQLDCIAKSMVKGLNRLNEIAQKQLRKNNEKYKIK